MLILILLFAINSFSLYSQDTLVSSGTLRRLGVKFLEKGEYQLSYFYNYSSYLLETDSVKKINAGVDAVDASLLTGHWKEAENLIFDLDNSRYKIADLLKMKYSYSLLMQKDYTRAGIYLSKIADPGIFKNQYHFMKAYAEINTRQKPECIKDLDLIDNSFIANEELTGIKNELAGPATFSKKHVGIALPLSVIVPGLGQAYSGFYFDALQSFGLNAAFGIGAYSAWKYELSKDKPNRNYVLPSLTTLIFSAFYITNLFNSVNVTQKANLFSENQYYRKIADHFDVILDRNQYFIRFKIDLKPGN